MQKKTLSNAGADIPVSDSASMGEVRARSGATTYHAGLG